MASFIGKRLYAAALRVTSGWIKKRGGDASAAINQFQSAKAEWRGKNRAILGPGFVEKIRFSTAPTWKSPALSGLIALRPRGLPGWVLTINISVEKPPNHALVLRVMF